MQFAPRGRNAVFRPRLSIGSWIRSEHGEGRETGKRLWQRRMQQRVRAGVKRRETGNDPPSRHLTGGVPCPARARPAMGPTPRGRSGSRGCRVRRRAAGPASPAGHRQHDLLRAAHRRPVARLAARSAAVGHALVVVPDVARRRHVGAGQDGLARAGAEAGGAGADTERRDRGPAKRRDDGTRGPRGDGLGRPVTGRQRPVVVAPAGVVVPAYVHPANATEPAGGRSHVGLAPPGSALGRCGVGERRFAWMGRTRRVRKDDAARARRAEAWRSAASCRRLRRRLAQ